MLDLSGAMLRSNFFKIRDLENAMHYLRLFLINIRSLSETYSEYC